jgi:hypothetical protein
VHETIPRTIFCGKDLRCANVIQNWRINLLLKQLNGHNKLHVRETCLIPGSTTDYRTAVSINATLHKICVMGKYIQYLFFVRRHKTVTNFLSIKMFICLNREQMKTTGNKQKTFAINIYKCRRARHHDFLRCRLKNNLTMQGAGAFHSELQLRDQPRGEDWLHSVRRDVLRTCTLHWSVFPPQSTYRGRVEIGGVYVFALPLS